MAKIPQIWLPQGKREKRSRSARDELSPVSLFEFAWKSLGGPALEQEYHFAPGRKYRADYAHVPTKTLIEIEGAVWTQGRHSRGSSDLVKYNLASALGWSLFRLSIDLVRDDPVTHVGQIIAFIAAKAP